jgi:hypothetical protein
VSFNALQFHIADRQFVISLWLKTGMQVDTIKDSSDKLLQENPRCYSDFPTQLTGHGFCQLPYIRIIASTADTICSSTVLKVDISDAAADKTQSIEVKRGQANLNGPWIVKPNVFRKVNMQTLSERLQSANALWTIEECWRASD